MTTNEMGNFEVWKVTQWHRCTGQDRRQRREGEMMRVRNEAENMWYASQGDVGSLVKWNDCCSLLSQQRLWWRSCRGRWQHGAGPGKGAAAAKLLITESRDSLPRKWLKRYNAARFKDPITKQRGNLDTNCDAFKFLTSNTRDGSVPPFHDNPSNALSR